MTRAELIATAVLEHLRSAHGFSHRILPGKCVALDQVSVTDLALVITAEVSEALQLDVVSETLDEEVP